LKQTIGELGFKEERDHKGKLVLKNNLPNKRNMNYAEVEALISRLKAQKNPSEQKYQDKDGMSLSR